MEVATNLTSDFNPRSREGSDIRLILQLRTIMISIHAPAKGATHTAMRLSWIMRISIHAPAKGATLIDDKAA